MSDEAPVWPWVIGGVVTLLMLGGTAVVVWGKTRGLRNNNPGNIRPGSQPYKGQVGIDNGPGGPFCVFGPFQGKPGEFWGLRAIAHTLGVYQSAHGLRTIQSMISRWAPSIENDTLEYINNVADALGISINQDVDLPNNPQVVAGMVKAITMQENGNNPYPDNLVAAAVAAA